jgi:hypothetical protein
VQSVLGANIPFLKVNNKIFRNFLTKYTDKEIPEESTLRKNYYLIVMKNQLKKLGMISLVKKYLFL